MTELAGQDFPRAESPRTLRLIFEYSDGQVRLLSHQRVPMTCPAASGAAPQAGRNGGFWIELRDDFGRVRFHRLLQHPLGDSVELHEPNGTIRRVFGPPSESVFMVLLPDDPEATSIVLMGDLDPAGQNALRMPSSTELARFAIPSDDDGSDSGQGLAR